MNDTDQGLAKVPLLVRCATIVLGAGLVTVAGVLALAISRTGSGLRIDQFVAFYLIPFATAGWLARILRGPPERRVEPALLLASIVVGLVAAEVAATSWVRRTEANGGSPATRSVGEEARALRDIGVLAYPTVPGNVLVDRNVALRIDSLRVHPLTTVPGGVRAVLCTRPEHTVQFTADRFGFNNPDTAWSDGADALLIGDSFTQGVCVQSADQIATGMLPRYRTLNLGNKGSGPLQELATLREYGSLVRPPVVFWIYYEGNDPYDLRGEVERPWLTEYLRPGHRQDLARQQVRLDAAFAAWIDSVLVAGPPARGEAASPRPFGIGDRARLATLRSLSGITIPFPGRSASLSILPDVLARALADVRGWEGRMILVYLPDRQRYTTVWGDRAPAKRDVLEAARSLKLPVLDLDPIFRATGHPTELWNGPRGHLTPEGYRIVAEALVLTLDTLGGGRPD